jgi:hypothetical protein
LRAEAAIGLLGGGPPARRRRDGREQDRIAEQQTLEALGPADRIRRDERAPHRMADADRDAIATGQLEHGRERAIDVRRERRPGIAREILAGRDRGRVAVAPDIEGDDAKPPAERRRDGSPGRRAEAVRMQQHDEGPLAAPVEIGELDARLRPGHAPARGAVDERKRAAPGRLPVPLAGLGLVVPDRAAQRLLPSIMAHRASGLCPPPARERPMLRAP